MQNNTVSQLRERLLAERQRVLALIRGQKSPAMDIRHQRQEAHLTTPAGNLKMARAAAERGCGSARAMLQRHGISTEALAARLQIPAGVLDYLIDEDPDAPLVMVDGEDALALNPDSVLAGRRNAVEIFRSARWGSSLRYYRPSGLDLDWCVDDLLEVLLDAGRERSPSEYPIDGIIWPKAELPEELALVMELLSRVEEQLGLKRYQIKLQFLVESGAAALGIQALIQVVLPRLTGIIFGIADYAADLRLPDFANNHPAADQARLWMINAAAAAGVPAIDSMTWRYPVVPPGTEPEEAREMVLAALEEAWVEARHGMDLGMMGKWAGHPLQLLAIRAAYRTRLDQDKVRDALTRVREYQALVQGRKGAGVIAGEMSDRATDRHLRTILKQAFSYGMISVDEAAELNLTTRSEQQDLPAPAQPDGPAELETT